MRKLLPWTPSQQRVGSVAIRILSALNIWAYRISGAKIGDRVVPIASKIGMSKHPVWYLDLVANPHSTVEIGREKRAMQWPGRWSQRWKAALRPT